MSEHSVLIAGIGNIFLGDDAFGSEVARKLMSRTFPPGVRVEDFGIRGLDLAYAMLDGGDLTVLIDATPRGGKAGTLYLIEPDFETTDELEESMIDAHSMNPIKVLAMVKSMGGTIRNVRIIGCEPAPLESEDGFMGLSAPVEAAIDGAVEMVEKLLNEFSAEQTMSACSL